MGLSTNLYNASHRKKNTLTPESIITVSVYEKNALANRKKKLQSNLLNNYNSEQKQQHQDQAQLKTSLNIVPPRVSYIGVGGMKINKNTKSLPFLNGSGY